ncbi:hypothetical protein RHGRI_028579 [Rhododendron griersonianum]|uniref:non-specific serine/threonine protein kinase n=1 Tax=Rhododendron griersonianum TaxID=479676 RepID=A0AAV6IH02_9ERIC|nr:hypothetical protein RHGRI_028579 [Rhododendron griersonianum]
MYFNLLSFTIPLYLILYQNLFSVATTNSPVLYHPLDNIAVDCGSSGNSTAVDGRQWTGDIGSKYAPLLLTSNEGKLISSKAADQPLSPGRVPFGTPLKNWFQRGIAFLARGSKSVDRISGSARKELTIFTDIGVRLTFEDVVRATGSFNASNCIGSGGFWATYTAEISPGVMVARKRLAIERFQGVQEFDAEIKTLGRLRHPNLVTLIGYHASETEMFLIYNYLPGGNLEKFIQERSTRAVDWRVLHKIALDIARALAYLHDQCVPRVLHRDVKPSNILLDDDYNAYLSDFGLARLLGTSETHATTGVVGTFGGYMLDPLEE